MTQERTPSPPKDLTSLDLSFPDSYKCTANIITLRLTVSVTIPLIKVIMPKNLTAAILVISDTASVEPSTDKAGPTLREVFTAADWDIVDTQIVPDDVLSIQRFVQRWSDGEDAANAIVTSGGTGFAVKDVTPEVSRFVMCCGKEAWSWNRYSSEM